MKPIPISAARTVAEKYGYDQIVIVGRKAGQDGGEHCTTYGVSLRHCEVAATIGEFFKHQLMLWTGGGRDMASAPRDGTHFLAYCYHPPAAGTEIDPDVTYPGFGEWREIFYKANGPMSTCWHAGDPYDSHSGREAPEHFGPGLPMAWLPLPPAPRLP
jgi:hypothetical protein